MNKISKSIALFYAKCQYWFVFWPNIQSNLAEFGIEALIPFACRHTIGSMATNEGMKPHALAYPIGDMVETVLRNYFHNNQKPAQMPKVL